MSYENLLIEIDGAEMGELYPDLVHLEVELDDELAAMFRLRLNLTPQPDGSWPHLDEEKLALWKKVTISAGFDDGVEPLISGYITHLKPTFPAELTGCTLEIWGMDGSVRMDREEKLKAWPNKKDSDIASELFSLYGFTPVVENTTIVHDEAISTIIQRESDMQFLKRLALRNGYECFVAGDSAYFRPPQVEAAPQPLLAVHFGDETNVSRLALEVNALAPANVTVVQLDRLDKTLLETTTASSALPLLGAANATQLLGAEIPPGQLYMRNGVTTGLPEMSALGQGLFHEADWFVTGEGEINAHEYGHVLKPRQTVTIKGIGELYSGVYYVNHVTHRFTAAGYTQSFAVKRNALKPTGDENFSAGSNDLLGGLL